MFMNRKIQYSQDVRFLTCSMDSTQSLSKSQQVILWISTSWFWSLYGQWKDVAEPALYWPRSQSADSIPLQDTLWSYSNQDSVVFTKEQTNRSMEPESTEIDPHKYSQLIFDRRAKKILWIQKYKTKNRFIDRENKQVVARRQEVEDTKLLKRIKKYKPSLKKKKKSTMGM